MKIDGSCHCGYITFEAEADPAKTAICNCTDCQTLSGAPFRAVIGVESDKFNILSGEPTIYVKTAESGTKRPQGFCPRCGTSIYSTSMVMGRKPDWRPRWMRTPARSTGAEIADMGAFDTILGQRHRRDPELRDAVGRPIGKSPPR